MALLADEGHGVLASYHRSRKKMVDGSGSAFGTGLSKSIDEPPAGRPRRGILAVHARHRNAGCLGLVHLELDAHQMAGIQVRLHHGDRHVAPAETRAEEGVLRAQVGEAPDQR